MLQLAQQQALEAGIPLLVVESDVVVTPTTIETLLKQLDADPTSGLIEK